MITCHRCTDIESGYMQAGADRKTAQSVSPLFQLHVHVGLRIISQSDPKIVGGQKIYAEHEMFGQCLNKTILEILFRQRLVYIFELPLLQMHGRYGYTDRSMRHSFGNSHLNVPRQLPAFRIVCFQLCPDIFQGHPERETLFFVVIAQPGINPDPERRLFSQMRV